MDNYHQMAGLVGSGMVNFHAQYTSMHSYGSLVSQLTEQLRVAVQQNWQLQLNLSEQKEQN